jgi:integrase
VATSGKSRQTRSRGNIRELPSGSLQVRVYGGVDPLTGKRHELTEVIPAGKDAPKLAEKARTRMLAEVDERRAPRTKATVTELMDRYLGMLDVENKTMDGYEGHVRRHIKPLLGHIQVGRIDGETLDSFYSELRRCRTHCRGKRVIEHHRGRGEHECTRTHWRCAAVPGVRAGGVRRPGGVTDFLAHLREPMAQRHDPAPRRPTSRSPKP